jgi:hypothetical protein
MNIRLIRILVAFFIVVALSSCNKPTYPKERTEESVIKLCKTEYGLDVKVKIVGSTLGVFIPIKGLIDPDLKLNQDAGEKIENVALSIHRVVTSTDRPLKFYTLVARDIDMPGGEFLLTGFIYDVIRVRLLDISRDEYFKRILRDFKFNPLVSGAEKIQGLFKTLNENPEQIQQIKHVFYPVFFIGTDRSQKIELLDMESKEISEQEALFYIKTKEYYEPLSQFEVYRAIFPPGFSNEYLILTNISMFPNPIKEIVCKYFYSGNEIRQRNLKETFEQYNDIGYIGIDGLPKKDLELDWFLGQQISRRIKILFEEDKKLKEKFAVRSSLGSVDNKIFRFEFSISPFVSSADDDEIIFSRILKLAGTAFHRYSFEDFEGIELINGVDGKKVFLSKDDLEGFRHGKIKIQDII